MISKLKNIALFIVFLISLIVICNFRYHYTSQELIIEKTAVLDSLSIVVRSINMHDTVYEDIVFLEEILQDKRIVLLGEQLHSDGTTFEVKSIIIR